MRKLFRAEYDKLRKLCLWVPLISASILVSFTCLEWYLYFRQGEAGVYAGFNVMYLFLSFTLLLTVSLLASLIAETEHRAEGWKLLFSMPVSRPGLYLAKALWVGILMLVTALLIIIGVCGVWVLYTSQPLPFLFLVKQIFGGLLSCLPVLGIQLYLSVRFSNPTFPLAVGLVGAISSLFIGRSGSLWIYFVPWAYPSLSSPFTPGYGGLILFASITGLILLGAGSVLYYRRDFY